MAETENMLKLERTQEIKLPAAVLSLVLSADGRTAYAACLDGGVWRVTLGSDKREKLTQHASYASGVVLTPDDKILISGGYDGELRWHHLGEGREVRRVQAHAFWSWDLALSPKGDRVASVTGQYLSGGYKYEPAPEREPSVRVYDVQTGALQWSLPHVPPVQAVAFSSDGSHLAAGNLMGEIRVWDMATGQQVSSFKTDDFTSWGIIKSHHYLGGVFCLRFHPKDAVLYACGMGPMVDPMAGNGIQRWQRFDWRAGKKLDQTHDGESGQGLMEAIAFHPAGKWFVMAGRLFQGKWNLAAFDVATGRNLFAIDAKHRITEAQFNPEGTQLVVAKARQQERKDGKWVDFGVIEVYGVSGAV